MKKLKNLADDYRQKLQVFHELCVACVEADIEAAKACRKLAEAVEAEREKITQFAPSKVYAEIRKNWMSEEELRQTPEPEPEPAPEVPTVSVNDDLFYIPVDVYQHLGGRISLTEIRDHWPEWEDAETPAPMSKTRINALLGHHGLPLIP